MTAQTTQHYDVLVVGSGFGGSVTALRLTEKGYKVGVLEAGRRFSDDEFAKTSWRVRKFLWAPQPRPLRHPAHPPAARRPRALRRRRRRRLAGLRQHALRAAEGVLPGPAVGGHHRLAARARAVLRPGLAHARRHRGAAPDAARPRLRGGGRGHGRRPHVQAHARRRLLRRRPRRDRRPTRSSAASARRAPGCQECGSVHDRLPAQRQEHDAQELPRPRRGRGRHRAPDDDRAGRSARGRRAATPSRRCAPARSGGGVRSPPTRSWSRRARTTPRSCCTA